MTGLSPGQQARIRPDAADGAGGAGLQGRVTTGDGWPLPGAAVTVIGPGGRQLGRDRSGNDGVFLLTVAGTGPVTVVVASPGIPPMARAVTLAAGQVSDLGDVFLGSPGRSSLPGPARWTIDPAHTIVAAEARHLGLTTVRGRFTRFAGELFTAEPAEQGSVVVNIEAASIDTGNADRDEHLRSADFLDVERFPVLTYRSERLVRQTDRHWLVDGLLTIRDVTRPVRLDAVYQGTGPDPWGGTRIALSASTQLARRDYEMTWNMGLPGGLVLVGPTLRIELEVQAIRQDD